MGVKLPERLKQNSLLILVGFVEELRNILNKSGNSELKLGLTKTISHLLSTNSDIKKESTFNIYKDIDDLTKDSNNKYDYTILLLNKEEVNSNEVIVVLNAIAISNKYSQIQCIVAG